MTGTLDPSEASSGTKTWTFSDIDIVMGTHRDHRESGDDTLKKTTVNSQETTW